MDEFTELLHNHQGPLLACDIAQLQISDIFSIEVLKDIQKTFGDTFGVGIGIFDTNGRPVVPSYNLGECCHEMMDATVNNGTRKCAEASRTIGEQACRRGQVVYDCCTVLGVLRAACPIIVGGVYMGSWGIYDRGYGDIGRKRIRSVCKQMNIEVWPLLAAHRRMPKTDLDMFQKAARFLELTTTNLSELCLANLNARRAADTAAWTSSAFEAVINAKREWIYVVDPTNCKILLYNNTIKERFRDQGDERACHELWWGEGSDYCRLCRGRAKSVARPLNRPITLEYYNPRLGCWIRSTEMLMQWFDGRNVLLKIDVDITDEEQREERIKFMAHHNPLTGLPNRRTFEERLDRLLSVEEPMGSMAMLDIDSFKNVNESYGHEYGDKLILEIIRYLTSIPQLESNIYNLGVDQFVILFDKKEAKEIAPVLEKLQERFRQIWEVDEHQFLCMLSVAVLSYPRHGRTSQELIRNCTMTLKNAKSQGGNRMLVYYSDEQQKMENRIRTERELQQAVLDSCKAFEVYYQPIVSCGGGIQGAEALVRWNHPERGVVLPDEFVSLVEGMGLIGKLGEFVLREACRECSLWHGAGRDDMIINVNLSIHQVYAEDIVSTVKSVLKETGLPPHSLRLELTESIAMTDVGACLGHIQELRNVGVQFALDDFGTGYSSLNSLRQLAMGVIKIDRTFTSLIEEYPYYLAFIRSIVELAHSADMRVCIEGVETDSQWSKMRDMRCDSLQGYLFGHPQPAKEFSRNFLAINQLTANAMC